MPEFRDVNQGAAAWKDRAEDAYAAGDYEQAMAAAAIAQVYVMQRQSSQKQ